MTYTVIAKLRRKPGITPAEFRTHYDTIHIPLLKSLVGPAFPLSHTRNYVPRKSNTEREEPTSNDVYRDAQEETPADLHRGSPADVPYDALTVMVWEDAPGWRRFVEVFNSARVMEEIREDERHFLDQDSIIVYAVGEQVITTTRD